MTADVIVGHFKPFNRLVLMLLLFILCATCNF